MLSQAQHPPPLRYVTIVAFGSNEASNLGKPKKTLRLACDLLSKRIGSPIRKSRTYRTPAFPAGAGPDFVNAAAIFETEKSPAQILALCHEIEQIAGRTRAIRWGQRTLDIDLIAYGDLVLPTPQQHHYWRDLPADEQTKQTPSDLIVPHPRLQDRAFVLVPMLDIAPDWTHPVLGLTTRQMLDARPLDEKAAVVPLDIA